MKTRYLILCSIFVVNSILAQDRYRINYDYKTDEVLYLKLDKKNQVIDTLENPKIKRNSLIEFKINNLNPFAVNVKADINIENFAQSGSNLNFNSLLGGINSFTGNKLNININPADLENFFNSGKNTDINGNDRGSLIAGDFSKFKKLDITISGVIETLKANLLNPNLEKQNIYDNLYAVTETIKGQDYAGFNIRKNYLSFLTRLEDVVDTKKSKLIFEVSDYKSFIAENNIKNRGDLVNEVEIENQARNILTQVNKISANSFENIQVLKSLFILLEASSFDKTYDYTLEADVMNFDLKFIQSDFSERIENNSDETILKTRKIKLFAKGGLKINTSIALTFNNFGANSKDFFIREDSTVGADSNTNFVPNIATMINFYPYSAEGFTIGGTFGLSIPISGEEKLGGINFLFGPSLFLGNKNRISFSGGLAFGQVKKLTNGLSIDDTTSASDKDDITKNIYELGYFFGLSFNLFDIN